MSGGTRIFRKFVHINLDILELSELSESESEIRRERINNNELTMVRPNIVGARPTAESTSFWLFRRKFIILAVLLTLTALFISRVGLSGVQEDENKLKIKPPSSFRQQQGLNHRPVDEECEHAVNRLVSSTFSAKEAFEMMMLFDYDMFAHTSYCIIFDCRL
jgi:hypothetical protein